MAAVSNIKVVGLILLIGLLLVLRYIYIGIDDNQIALFALYYFISTVLLLFSRIRYNNIINPISIFTIFLYLLSYSFLRLSNEQVLFSLNTYLIINLSIIVYVVFAIVRFPYKPVKLVNLNSNLRKIFIYGICFLSLITFAIECSIFGYIPILNVTSIDVYNETNEKLVPFLHYFIILLAFVPAWSYILYKENILTKKEFILFVFFTVFILLNYLSKQTYLLLGLTSFMAFSFYNNLNTKNIFRSIAFVFILFSVMGYLRFNSELPISISEYYRAISGIENEDVNIFEAAIVEYSSKRFSVLDDMVNFRDDIGYWGFGSYTFRPLFSLFFLEKFGVIKRIPQLDSESRVGTYLVDPYLDFGFIGVIILNSIYGYLASRYFYQLKDKHPEAIIKFSIIIFCIFMGVFVNFFNTMLVWMGLIFNKLLVGSVKNKNN